MRRKTSLKHSYFRYFVFGRVEIPSDVSGRFQLTLIRQLETEKETFVQVKNSSFMTLFPLCCLSLLPFTFVSDKIVQHVCSPLLLMIDAKMNHFSRRCHRTRQWSERKPTRKYDWSRTKPKKFDATPPPKPHSSLPPRKLTPNSWFVSFVVSPCYLCLLSRLSLYWLSDDVALKLRRSFFVDSVSIMLPLQVNSAHRDGLRDLYTSLGITDEKHKASISYIRCALTNYF